MFYNIAGKIKSVAVIVAVVGILIYTISGCVDIFSGSGNFFIGMIGIVVGSLVSWVISLLLYGFGALVENSETIAHYITYPTTNSNQEGHSVPLSTVAPLASRSNPTKTWTCSACNATNSTESLSCKECGRFKRLL